MRDDRPDISHANCRSILGGLCEDGETASDALRRELFEEAAVTLDDATPLCSLIDRGARRHLLAVFVVETHHDRQEMKLAEGQWFDMSPWRWLRHMRTPITCGSARPRTRNDWRTPAALTCNQVIDD
ncbi:NUDIX domain-containing protein [Phytohabitans sp. ZYX-F-186]|uniref:NUDIX domain-containing protein n=1 Tax=Phytohabitans maris TaxID=3071409 RepID=A0ABU0ZFX0_9ACTN|nr:NUDIX domain-containing protein [Phytohabitans sp. ZYX-F-186]MDQ7905956.1 NUDIX domain-containing protein [Phytohabitans sp. ZYX-F-186]